MDRDRFRDSRGNGPSPAVGPGPDGSAATWIDFKEFHARGHLGSIADNTS